MPVARQTLEMLASSGMAHLAPHARTAIEGNYVRPNKRIFDNAKVSDHFAIIPTLQAGQVEQLARRLGGGAALFGDGGRSAARSVGY
ncbi:MAG: hypothetical protein WAT33_16530 [Giesbergeria sp.]